MRVDGGAAANNLLMQFQSDISGVAVERPSELESTARGAAMLAGIGAKLFATGREAAGMVSVEKTFQVTMSDSERNLRRERWNDAVRRTRGGSGSKPQG